MKQILLLLFITFSLGLSAQITFQTENLEVNFVAAGNYDEKVELEVTNSDMENVDFTWDVETVEASPAWNFYVCDFNKCYGPGTTFVIDPANTILGGETRNMQFHLQPNSKAGVGTYIMRLKDVADPTVVLATITIVFDGTLVATLEENINELAIFPNPVQDYFQLTNPEDIASKVILYDLLGKEVRTFPATGSEYYIGDLSEGRYFARIFDEDGKALKVLKIVKRHSRP